MNKCVFYQKQIFTNHVFIFDTGGNAYPIEKNEIEIDIPVYSQLNYTQQVPKSGQLNLEDKFDG